MAKQITTNFLKYGASLYRNTDISKIPGPPELPLIGTAYQYFKGGNFKKTDYHNVLVELHRQYGPLVRENIGGKKIIHVFDPDDIQQVYAVEGKYPEIPPLQETTQMYRAQKGMSLGLGNTNGEEWYRLRSNSQQMMLRPKEVKRYLPGVNVVAQDFIRYIQRKMNEQEIDLRMEIGLWSLENNALMVLNKRLGCFDNHNSSFGRQMVEANARIFELSGILKLSVPIYKYLPTPKWRALIKAEDYFYKNAIRLVDSAILEYTKLIETNSKNEETENFIFLSYLLSREELSLKDVTIICLSLLADALSTTTPTILFNLYCLSRNSDAQTQIYHEILAATDKEHPDEPIMEHQIAQMPYLKAFIKETFRLWPNGTEVSRYLPTDLVLSGYKIPHGTHVDLNPIVHYKNATIFPDPLQHRPERWLRNENNETPQVHPYILTPFGHGTRMCAGRRFAEQDLYVLLASIVRNFKLENKARKKDDKKPLMGQIYNTLLFPDRPLRVRFIKRKQFDK